MKIQDLIDKHLKEEREIPRERSGKFSPSSFGRCFRNQIWNRANEKQSDPPDERVLRIFAIGNILGDWVQTIIVMNFLYVEIEKKVETENVLGYADAILEDEVIEIKSIHSRGFWHMDKEDFQIAENKKEHILQAMTYAFFLNKKSIKLVYISKDDLCMREFNIQVTDEWKQKVTEEIQMLDMHWDNYKTNGILPDAKPRAYISKDGPLDCTYCNFRTKCEAIEKLKNNENNT